MPRHMQICSCLRQEKRFQYQHGNFEKYNFCRTHVFQNTMIFFCPQANFIVVFLFLSGALVPNGMEMKASLLSCQLETTICKL